MCRPDLCHHRQSVVYEASDGFMFPKCMHCLWQHCQWYNREFWEICTMHVHYWPWGFNCMCLLKCRIYKELYKVLLELILEKLRITIFCLDWRSWFFHDSETQLNKITCNLLKCSQLTKICSKNILLTFLLFKRYFLMFKI